MVENKNDNLHTEELVLEIENVIKKGLKKILSNYMDRFDLLEQTHNQIMMLPSVVNELNQSQNKNFNSNNHTTICERVENKIEPINITDITDITKNLVKGEISTIEEKLENMER